MCGRYQITKEPRCWLRPLRVNDLIGGVWTELYNIYPSSQVPVVRDGPERELVLVKMQWGFVPHWQHGQPSIRPINAKAEGIHEKRFWKDSIEQRRCLLPATGFYEWKTVGKDKIPYVITVGDGKPFLMAGVWDRWQAPDGEVETVAIVTTAANEAMGQVHDRMPVIIPMKQARDWIYEPDNRLLMPISSDKIQLRQISKRINNPQTQGPYAFQPAEVDVEIGQADS